MTKGVIIHDLLKCKKLKPVIEVDGLTHQWEDLAVKDNQRDNALERAGFKVIGFIDKEILKNMNAVIEAIQCEVGEREKNHPLHPRQRGTVTAFLLDLLKDFV